jgi:predicted RNase H-like nuclease (RuvC/YqgF family)
MCKSELRKNIVSLLIENDKLKIQYDTDIRQHRLTIRNLEKNIEKIEKDLEEKNKEVTMLRDEIDSYEIYEPESSDSSNIFISQVNKKIFTEYMLVFIGCILIYSVILNGLVARIIE